MNHCIAPSILSFPHGEIIEYVKRLGLKESDWLHIDVMDGQFVPPISFGAGMAANVVGSGVFKTEAHLMTFTPDRQFEAFKEAGVDRVIFHAEATFHAHRLIQTLHSLGLQAGVAINPATPVDVIQTVISDIDLALVMTVNPGWGGQSFISSALDKVRALRKLRSDLDIEVDGGIDLRTLPLAREAGANFFVVGSYLAKQSDPHTTFRELEELCVSR